MAHGQDTQACKAGLPIVQVDEAAFREGLPLRRSDWPQYLDRAVNSFRLATSGVQPYTQIHAHMCYSDFGDIIEAIAAMDADVISIEDARSDGALLQTLRDFKYRQQIGQACTTSIARMCRAWTRWRIAYGRCSPIFRRGKSGAIPTAA